MIEVEIKAKIDAPKIIINKLEQLGAKKGIIEYQQDIYFKSPIVDFTKTDECLRIRNSIKDGKEEIFMTYKGPKLDAKSQTRKEIEIPIDNCKKGIDMFESLGFTQAKIVKKNRQNYIYKDFKISLDYVEGLEPYMEIEKESEEGKNFLDSQNQIFELFKMLGIEKGFERKSYLELLEEK